MELKSNQTRECWTKQSVLINRILSDGSRIKINVVNIAIQRSEPQPHLNTHLQRALTPAGDGLKVADFSEGVVVRDSVISSALNVPSNKITTELCLALGRMFLEEMIGNLICKASVDFLCILVEQTKNHWFNVNQMFPVEFFPIEQITESPEDLLVGEDNFEQAVNHRMTKSEGCCGKFIQHRRIGVGIIFTFPSQVQLVFFHKSSSFTRTH